MKARKLIVQLLPAYIFIALLLVPLILTKVKEVRSEPLRLAALTRIVNGEGVSENIIISGKPVNLFIPSIDLELTIEAGNYEETTKTWNISATNAHFATITKEPNNEAGLTVIYGHNTNKVLGKTKDLENGDKLYVTSENEYIFEYELTGSSEVIPSDTSIFEYSGEPKLTLITCFGIADQKRRLLSFKLVEVKQ